MLYDLTLEGAFSSGVDIEADVIVAVRRSKVDEVECSGATGSSSCCRHCRGKGEARYARTKGKVSCSVG